MMTILRSKVFGTAVNFSVSHVDVLCACLGTASSPYAHTWYVISKYHAYNIYIYIII